jgi:hypothetical protein
MGVAVTVAAACSSGGRSSSEDGAPEVALPAPISPVTYTLLQPGDLESGGTLALSRVGGEPLSESSWAVAAGESATLTVEPGAPVLATWAPPSGPPWTRWLDPSCSAEPESGAWGQRVLRVPQEYATIQEAIDAAAPGETVHVAPGLYGERVRLRDGVRLVGSGAHQTVFDGGGAALTLVDFSGARDVVIAGFTFRNVGRATGCSQPDDPFHCSGDWYSPAIFGDGHGDATTVWPPACATSAVVAHNVFEGNHIGLLAYFRGRVVVRNNVFRGNEFGVVANHLQDSAVVEGNVFWENRRLAVGSQAVYLDLVENVIARSAVGVRHEYVQTGRIRCNAFFENGTHATSDHGVRVVLGADGNVEVDAGFVDPGVGNFHLGEGSPLRDAGCFEGESSDPDGSRRDVGAYGGPLGVWTDG